MHVSICTLMPLLMQFYSIDSKSSSTWLTLICITFRSSIRVFFATWIGYITLNVVSLNISGFGALLSTDWFPLIENLFLSYYNVSIFVKAKFLLEVFLASLLFIVKSNFFPIPITELVIIYYIVFLIVTAKVYHNISYY